MARFCAPLWTKSDSLVSGEDTIVNVSNGDVDQYKNSSAGQSDGTGSDGSVLGRVCSEGLMAAALILSLGLITFLWKNGQYSILPR